MIWDLLLSSTIGAVVEFLTQAGLGGIVRELRERLNKDGRARRRALEQAIEKALEGSGRADELRPLLEHRPVRDMIIESLLDPARSLDFRALAQEWGDRFPALRVPLIRFFNTLSNVLLADAYWGPILERYYLLRDMEEVKNALEKANLASPEEDIVPRVSAVLFGSGSIAQGEGAVALGQGATYVGGDYHQVVQIVLQQILQAEPALPEEPRTAYLTELARRANLLPWAPLLPDQSDPHQEVGLTLSDVYVDLDTTELEPLEQEEELRQYLARQHELERISAQAMLNQKSRLVLLGDPGSGKSTFVKYVAYLLTQANLAEEPSSWLGRLSPWDHGVLLPVWIELRQMAAFAREQRAKRGNERLVRRYLRHFLEEDLEIQGFWEHLLAQIRDEDMTLLFLLDGLDEVPKEQRQVIVDALNDFCDLYQHHRYLVTSRPYAYVGHPWQLRGFHQATLAPFNEKQIRRFIDNWYEKLVARRRLERDLANKMRKRLHASAERRDLREMAQRPLLLTVMAQLNTFRGRLPDDRTELYAEAVRLLLDRWEQRLGEEGVLERLNIPGLRMSDLEAGLYEIAYDAHKEMPADQDTADIPAERISKILASYLDGSWDKANEFVAYIRERAGLLIARKTESYTFPHRTFQEFLAACYLVHQEDYITKSAELVSQDWDRWREVFVLAAGYAARTHRLGAAVSAVNALLPRDYRFDRPPSQEEWQAALLAGEALLEIGWRGVKRKKVGEVVYERVRKWLLAAMRADNALPPVTRAAAGRTLAKLGDPRFDPDHWHLSREPLLGFVPVPEGKFIMGSGEEQHPVDLPTYYIARHPVTVAQFRAFVRRSGYKPRDPDSMRGVDNHPVVWVTWYDALAYARWLDERLKEIAKERLRQSRTEVEQDFWGGLAEGRYRVTLPSEAEWEKAARGGLEIPTHPYDPTNPTTLNFEPLTFNPTPDRTYPWGDAPDPNRTNHYNTGVGTTNAVGCFPGGGSPYGVEEMSGNVWEWTRSLWGKSWKEPEFTYPYRLQDGRENIDAPSEHRRVVRGGSWSTNSYDVRLISRRGISPNGRDSDIGFRVAIVPNLDCSPH